jgi:hypothetical protein
MTNLKSALRLVVGASLLTGTMALGACSDDPITRTTTTTEKTTTIGQQPVSSSSSTTVMTHPAGQ